MAPQRSRPKQTHHTTTTSTAPHTFRHQRTKSPSPAPSQHTPSAPRRKLHPHASNASRQRLVAPNLTAKLSHVPRNGHLQPPSPFAPAKPHTQRTHARSQQPPKLSFCKFADKSIRVACSGAYPEEYQLNGTICVCERCLSYSGNEWQLQRHKAKCYQKGPPGQEIYSKGEARIYEVDGRKEKLYCQYLCLLGKLWLEHKVLCFDVEPFLFYVLTINHAFVGYFSKDKTSAQNNLSCIVTLPIFQGKGYGSFLIKFSYLLSRREGRTGTAERPFSSSGKVAYDRYWMREICRMAKEVGPRHLRIRMLEKRTGMCREDIWDTLQSHGCLSKRLRPATTPGDGHYAGPLDAIDKNKWELNVTHNVAIPDRFMREYSRWEKEPGRLELDESRLVWKPHFFTPTKDNPIDVADEDDEDRRRSEEEREEADDEREEEDDGEQGIRRSWKRRRLARTPDPVRTVAEVEEGPDDRPRTHGGRLTRLRRGSASSTTSTASHMRNLQAPSRSSSRRGSLSGDAKPPKPGKSTSTSTPHHPTRTRPHLRHTFDHKDSNDTQQQAPPASLNHTVPNERRSHPNLRRDTQAAPAGRRLRNRSDFKSPTPPPMRSAAPPDDLSETTTSRLRNGTKRNRIESDDTDDDHMMHKRTRNGPR